MMLFVVGGQSIGKVLSAADSLVSEVASTLSISDIILKGVMMLAGIWLLLEIGFFMIIHFFVLPNAQKLSKPQPYHGDMLQMMKRAADLVKQLHCYSFDKYLSGFCCGANFEDIHLENWRSFLAWAMYTKHLPDLDAKELEDLEVVNEYAQKEHPIMRTMKPGFNPAVKHCRMTMDPIPIIHRPLLMYVLIRLKESFTNNFFLTSMGFQFLEVDGQTYWYKAQGSKDSNASNTGVSGTGSNGSEPMLFLHGISTGWGSYINMALGMGQGRSIFLVDMDSVKLNSLVFKMPTPQQFSDKVSKILDRHHVDRVSVVGHSFGSITAGWFIRHFPERVSHLTLIDPVSMLLSFPEVAFSFLYRQPSTVMEWVIHVFAAREITISHTLRRNFWWYNNDLWLETIPAHIGVVVGLATGDEIINPKALEEYVGNCRTSRIRQRESSSSESARTEALLAKADSFSELDSAQHTASPSKTSTAAEVAMIECLIWEKFSHGQILCDSQSLDVLMATVRSNEKLGTRSL